VLLTTSDAAALDSPSLQVVPPVEDAVLGRMARFSEGARHAAGRAVVFATLPDPAAVDAVAADLTRADLAGRDGPFDAMPLARTVPVTALGLVLGLPPEVPPLVRRLCDRLAAGDDTTAVTAALTDVDTAALSILFQAHDAVAALIGLRLLGRDDPPVRNTRRRANAAVVLADAAPAAGDTVVVDLADIGTYGAGRHACPGRDLAAVLADAVVATVHAAGWRAIADQPLTLLPRPNLNLPATVHLHRP
jgi:cytochrome P450